MAIVNELANSPAKKPSIEATTIRADPAEDGLERRLVLATTGRRQPQDDLVTIAAKISAANPAQTTLRDRA